MWPLDALRRRKYLRRYKAALVVLLGTYTYDRLTTDQRGQVELKAMDFLSQSEYAAVPSRAPLFARPNPAASAFRCAAMESLGIPPLVQSLTWEDLFQPWGFWRIRKVWPYPRPIDFLPFNLAQDFRPMDKATADAREFLRAEGLDIPEFDPWDKAPSQHCDVQSLPERSASAS